ncbi:MAG: Gfo/Idh/MocA family oxidoreductase [Planctomycetota bacterium]
MSGKAGFAAIGMGDRLNSILKMLLENHSDVCELKAISDESSEALSIAQKLWGTDIPAFSNYRQAIDIKGVDWVLIASKNYLHKDHCVDSFAAGKHVFCEKPLAITIEQCEQIRNAHHKSNKLFITGFVLRYAPLYRKIKELITNGVLGRLVSIEGSENLGADHGSYIMRNWRRYRKFSGPHLLEKCCHDFDLINWMVDSVATRVASFGGLNIFVPENKSVANKLTKPDDKPPLFYSWPAWEEIDPFMSEKDIEDNQVAILEYRNNVRVMFHTNSCNAFSQRRMFICGLEGTLEADVETETCRWKRIGRGEKMNYFELKEKAAHGGGNEIIVADIARCMRTGEHPEVSGEEGFISAITALAIDKALQEKKVVDVEHYWQKFGI